MVSEAQKTIPAKPSLRRFLFRSRLWSDLAIAFSLLVIVSFIWTANSGLWTREAWNLPVGYEGDSYQILGWIKAASEGEYHLLDLITISRLGAPFGANWNDYPMYEKAFTILLGWLARPLGLFAAANAGMMLTHATAAASFYLACRFFRWQRAWSFAGSLLFAFTYYMTLRSLGHMLLGITYTIPWALFSVWLLIGRHKLKRFSRPWKFCLGVSFLMGVSCPYYLNIYVQFLFLSLGIQWLTLRRKESLQTGLLCVVTAGAGFIFIHTGSLLYRCFAGGNPYAIARSYRESELYALRPIELIIPPAEHRLSWFSKLGTYYQNEVLNRGEIFSPYLGIAVALGFLLLIAVAFRRLLQNDARHVPFAFWQAGWLLAYSVIGGFNCIFALGGIALFRASNRNSIFLSAIVLLWLVSFAARRFRNWSPSKVWILSAVICLFGIADQLPAADRAKNRLKVQSQVDDDRSFGRQLESRLPANALIFQLPMAEFPEGSTVTEMGAYEHLRPYFFTTSLRFSYGMNKGRSDSSWQAEVERLPASLMVKRLEALGFQALYLNRKGFVDGGASLLAALDKLGYQERWENAVKELVVIPLKPAPNPELPRLDQHPVTSYGSYWRRFDFAPDDVLWVSEAHALIQLNPVLFAGKKAHLKAVISVPTERTVYFLMKNKTIAYKKLQPNDVHTLEFDFEPQYGQSLRIETDQPKAAFRGTDFLQGTFALVSLKITAVP